MAHTALFGHVKLTKLVKALDCPRPHVIGYWECLCNYVATHNVDGNISNLTDDEIELAAEWVGEPGKFIAAAIGCRFVDRDASGTRIHDWRDWAPEWVKKRIKRAEEAAEKAKRQTPADSGGHQEPPAAHDTMSDGTMGNDEMSRPELSTPVRSEKSVVSKETGTGTGAVAPRNAPRTGPDRESGGKRLLSMPPTERKNQLAGELRRHASATPLWTQQVMGLISRLCGMSAAEYNAQRAALRSVCDRFSGHPRRDEIAAEVIELALAKRRCSDLNNPWAAWQRAVDQYLATVTQTTGAA